MTLYNTSFFIRIEGPGNLLKMLPDQWDDYFGKGSGLQNGYVLRLKELSTLNDLKCSPGWSCHMVDNTKYTVYSSANKPEFALTYNVLSAKEVTVCVRKPLDSFVRIGVLYGMLTALHQFCIGLHGVTLRCGGQTLILSAPSGTGKTTLSHLLEKYCDAKIINGDFALLMPYDNYVMFEPTPFCGTSLVCNKDRVRVDRIVFLSQAKENIWETLDGRQSLLHMLENVFVPTFDLQLKNIVCQNVVRTLSMVPASLFAFEPTKAAAFSFLDSINTINTVCF